MAPTRSDFENRLNKILSEAESEGNAFVDVSSGALHRDVGEYPGQNHRMPLCCDVMRNKMKAHDKILKQPPSGQGIILIRYFLKKNASILEEFRNVGLSQIEAEEKIKSQGDRIYYPNFEKNHSKLEDIIWIIAAGPVIFGMIALAIYLLLS